MPPGFFRAVNPDRDNEGIIIRHDDLTLLLHPPQTPLFLMRRELSAERVVDLEKNLDFFQVIVDVKPGSVDNIGDGGLGNPSKRFGEKTIYAIEVVTTIAESVLDIAAALELLLDSVMPGFDTGIRAEIDALESLGLGDCDARCNCHGTGSTTVVGISGNSNLPVATEEEKPT